MEGKDTLISVIVPVYNTRDYLEECIGSLVAQTYRPVEFLLIDDGSSDGSGEVCDKYASLYPEVRVIHKENGGVSSARNIGIQEAKGECLVFVDSDDKIHHGLLEMYIKNFEDSFILVCQSEDCREMPIDRKYDEYQLRDRTEYTIEDFMRFFCDDYVNPPWNKLYVSKILKDHEIYFPEGMSLGEDLVFNLEYMKYAPKKYRVMTAPMYYYRLAEKGSLSSSFPTDLFEIQIYLFEILKEFMEVSEVYRGENKKKYAEVFWNRLYMTACMYKCEEEKESVRKKRFEIMRHPIWENAWKLCREENVVTLKMYLKKMHLFFLRIK